MTFEEVVHTISPPQPVPFWPFPQLYSYQLARFALDNWYRTTKEYINYGHSSMSASFNSWTTMNVMDEKKDDVYSRQLDEKYNNYSEYLEKLHDSMLIA